mmetsp:Transcript_2051/g.5436  ORF Transcript_2051/g.5436 Transcript_2051/m.5436 type:complete len:616 (-) Transcript_2051:144-1991(-)
MVGPPESNVAIELMEEDQPFDVVKANSSLDENYNRRPLSYAFEEEEGDLPALSMSTSHASAASNGNNSQSSTVDVHQATLDMNKKAAAAAASASALNDSALSQATTLTRNVTGGRSTHTRPMSPPSRAGLDDPKDYQKGNANTPGRWRSSNGTGNGSPENDDENDYADATGNAYNNNEYDDTEGDTSPPRERLPRGQSYKNEMPMDERREYEDEMKALALCDYGEGSQAMPEFCDSALRAMNELCAGGAGADTATFANADNSPSRRYDGGEGSESPSASAATRRKLRLGEKHSVHNGASGVEEQTAIEVEYVEPLYRGREGEDDGADYSSPKRKNALLKAMTRRAKDDYKTRGKKKKKGAAEEGTGTTTTMATNDEIAELESQSQQGSEAENRDNVYATFSSVEKRKFLQLINGGVSPTDATSKILRDRRNRDERDDDDPSVAESSIPSDYPGMHEDDENGDGRDRRSVVAVKSGKKGINKLAFWKRKSKGAAPVASVVTPKTSPEKTATTRADPAPERNDQVGDDDGEDGDSQSTSSCEHVGDEIKKFLKEEREENRAKSKAKMTAPSKTQETAVRGANEIIGDLHRSMNHNRNNNNNNNKKSSNHDVRRRSSV